MNTGRKKLLTALVLFALLTGCAAGEGTDSAACAGPAAASAAQSAEEQSAEQDSASSSQSVQVSAEASTEPVQTAPESSVSVEPMTDTSAPMSSEPAEQSEEQSVEPEQDPEWLLAEPIYAHRGASGYEVEHTFAAYDLAIEQGAHYIEQDLVTSKDGTLYVSHDDSASRIAGMSRDYSQMSDETIRQLRTANGEGIHSMAEVFERYGDSVYYVVELKAGKSQSAAFAELVRDMGMEGQVIVQSFYPEALEALEEEFPDMPKLQLCRDQESVNRAVERDWTDIVCVKGSLMTKKNCKKVHKAGKRFCVYWTDGEQVKKAIKLGVDCYFTNYPDTALALEREYRHG